MQHRAWLIRLDEPVSPKKSDRIDRRAEQIVTRAYGDACRDRDRAPRAFELAVEAYRQRFPRVPQNLAGHAVADILARQEVLPK